MKRDLSLSWVYWVMPPIALVLLVYAATGGETLVRLAGLWLVMAGLALRRWAINHLIAAGIDTMVLLATASWPRLGYTDSGPYRFLRHPAYVGSGLIFSGAGLLCWGEWAGAGLVFAAWPHYAQRIVLEDDMRRKRELVLQAARIGTTFCNSDQCALLASGTVHFAWATGCIDWKEAS